MKYNIILIVCRKPENIIEENICNESNESVLMKKVISYYVEETEEKWPGWRTAMTSVMKKVMASMKY